jgi:hypothetical protein
MTEPQRNLVDLLSRQLHLPPDIRDAYCRQQFDRPFDQIDVRQASDLIGRMKAWQQLPPEIARLKGQLDLLPEVQP